MNNYVQKYNELIQDFGDTLKNTSLDIANTCYMTMNTTAVVNFDNFKRSIAKKLHLPATPKSCDTLCYENGQFFLIEFKNGKIGKAEIHQIREKIFESLLLLTEKLNVTIDYTRKNLTFILVYNDSAQGRHKINSHLSQKAKTTCTHFGLTNFKRIYFNDVFEMNINEFERNFVAIYFP
ncbi:MAG: hypothetical protein LBE12_19250 [Planctomycetaceae bacterium]|jgi:hypothetical protein|nr:hypothetical protein [Planctomycetaceae bacterium]